MRKLLISFIVSLAIGTLVGTCISILRPVHAQLVLPGNIFSCGASLAAAGVCPNTALGSTFHITVGSFLLASNTSTVTGITPAYSSATSWWCVANDVTTRANPVQAIPASGTSVVITNTTGASDLIQMICFGN